MWLAGFHEQNGPRGVTIWTPIMKGKVAATIIKRLVAKPPTQNPELARIDVFLRERVRLELVVGALEERRLEPAFKRRILLGELLHLLGLGSFQPWLVGALVRLPDFFQRLRPTRITSYSSPSSKKTTADQPVAIRGGSSHQSAMHGTTRSDEAMWK